MATRPRSLLAWCAVLVLGFFCFFSFLSSEGEALGVVPAELDVKVAYDVVFSPEPLSAEDAQDIPVSRLYPMRQTNGSAYVCVLPPTEEEIVAAQMIEKVVHGNRRTEVGALLPGDEVPVAISQPLHDLIAADGVIKWTPLRSWEYSLCLGQFVRQQMKVSSFAKSPNGNAQAIKSVATVEFYLGMDSRARGQRQLTDSVNGACRHPIEWDTAYTFERDHWGPYLSSQYLYGDTCDLTGEYRETEVRLRCLENADFSTNTQVSVREVGTCAYIVDLYDRRLCVPGLLATPSLDLSIVCHPIQND